MTQQILAKKFLKSARVFGAVMCAGLFILVLFTALKTETCSASTNSESRLALLASREPVAAKSSFHQKAATPEAKNSDEISLDYHPWQGDPPTFVVVREDGSVKLVRYDRRLLTVSEHQEGVLAAPDVAEIFATIRKPTFRRALRKRLARDEGADADFFYVGLKSASGEQGRWFSTAERAPRTVFLLVEKLLALNKKIQRISHGSFDYYLRADKLSAQDTKAVLKKGRPPEIDEFPSALQEIIGRAVVHPKEFFLITAQQAGELQRMRNSMLRRAGSVYELQLFQSLLIPPGKLIKEPPNNEEAQQGRSRFRPASRFKRAE